MHDIPPRSSLQSITITHTNEPRFGANCASVKRELQTQHRSDDDSFLSTSVESRHTALTARLTVLPVTFLVFGAI